MATRQPTKTDTQRAGYGSCRCGAWWTGHRNGHCTACHHTFSGGAFDRHQRMRGGRSVCLAPDEVGLVPRQKAWGTVWGSPGTWTGPKAGQR